MTVVYVIFSIAGWVACAVAGAYLFFRLRNER
jgi:hypothetical protein